MNIFLKKLLLFTLPVITIITSIIVLYKIQLNKLELPANNTILISGDSHMKTGLNDSLINHSLNIAQYSEGYLFTYNILSRIINNNKSNKIKYVLVGCSVHSFGNNWDIILQKTTDNNEMCSRYLSILALESIGVLLHENTFGTLNMLPAVMKKASLSIIHNDTKYIQYPFIGSYTAVSDNKISDSLVNKAIQRHYEYSQASAYQFTYLEKIIDLCKQNNIKVVLLSTPLHKKYRDLVPQFNKDLFNKNISKIKNDIIFLDYSSLEFADKCYQDGDHLNKYGATIFSKIIDKKLKEFPQK